MSLEIGFLIGVILVFVMMAFVLLRGKGAFLIAGYNTMSAAEKERYDEVALCKFMGKLMLSIAFSMLFILLDAIFEVGWGFIVGTISILVLSIGGVIYMSTGNRFEK
ncbi:MAG: DUF3784 domain-containing protein [Lysinibacillus sp.]